MNAAPAAIISCFDLGESKCKGRKGKNFFTTKGPKAGGGGRES